MESVAGSYAESFVESYTESFSESYAESYADLREFTDLRESQMPHFAEIR